MPQIIIYSSRVLIKDQLVEASLLIRDGVIQDIEFGKYINPDYQFEDYGDAVIFPGVIDAHIHINEPGRTDWEGFDTATRAAAAGGITTLIDMPLNSSPVTIDSTSFRQKVAASEGKRHVHCGFWGGLIPQNAADLSELLSTGILGVKAFLTHSGIDEFPNVSEQDLRNAMPQLAEAQIPLLAHCELDQPHSGLQLHQENPRSYKHFVNSRPPAWENEAVRLMIKLCREYRCPVHIVHLSSADVLPEIQRAKEDGLPLTVETCPHYLYFDEESIPYGDTRFKCTPPIRHKANNEQLWEALASGLIDFIATDHSPAPPAMKEIESGNLHKAWGGISGGQFLLSATWTKAKARGLTLPQLASWLCHHPAQFIGHPHSKGQIQKGADADLVVWYPESSFVVKEELVNHRHVYSPYVGQELLGVIHTTYCKGQVVFRHDEFQQLGLGGLLLRKDRTYIP